MMYGGFNNMNGQGQANQPQAPPQNIEPPKKERLRVKMNIEEK